MSFKFTGRSVALIAPRGPHYGAVGVALDGGRFHRTSLYAASRTPQGLVYVLNLPTTGKHRIVVIARAVEGRHRVDIDAFTTLRD